MLNTGDVETEMHVHHTLTADDLLRFVRESGALDAEPSLGVAWWQMADQEGRKEITLTKFLVSTYEELRVLREALDRERAENHRLRSGGVNS